jgi:CheY-like chemotaxis protein
VSPTILIVDDDDVTRAGLTELLLNAGYHAISASSLQDGLRALREHTPDLLITDVRLGAFNGLQLLATSPTVVPTIVVSGFADPVVEADAHRLGADYLVKPIQAAILFERIERKLDQAAKRPANGRARRSDRRLVNRPLPAWLNDIPAQVMDVSYGGLLAEISHHPDVELPPTFTVNFREPGLSLPVRLVWASRSDDRLRCGVAIDDATAAPIPWFSLVDTVP